MNRFKGELYEVNKEELAEFQAVALLHGWGVSVEPIDEISFKVVFYEVNHCAGN